MAALLIVTMPLLVLAIGGARVRHDWGVARHARTHGHERVLPEGRLDEHARRSYPLGGGRRAGGRHLRTPNE